MRLPEFFERYLQAERRSLVQNARNKECACERILKTAQEQ